MRFFNYSRVQLFIFALLATFASAVYDDEAYKTDWHHQQLGQISQSAISVSGAHYVFLSKANILSVVENFNKGEIKWRHKLSSSSEDVYLDIVGDGLVITGINSNNVDANGNGKAVLQLWNQTTSFLVDEIPLNFEIAAIKTVNGDNIVIVGSNNIVYSIKTENSLKVKRLGELTNGNGAPVNQALISGLNNGNFLVLVNERDLYLLNPAKFTETVSHISLADHGVAEDATKILKIYQNKIFYETQNGLVSVLIFNDIVDDLSNTKTIKTEYTTNLFNLLDLNSYILVNNFEYYSSSVKDKSIIQFAKTINEHSVIAFSHNHIQLFDSEFGIEHVKFTHNLDLDFNDIKDVKVSLQESSSNSNQGHKVVAIIELNNGEIIAVQNDLKLWKRDESLSEITGYLIYNPSRDLKTQLQETEDFKNYLNEEESSLLSAFISRWKTHLKYAKLLDQFLRNAGVSDYLKLILGNSGEVSKQKLADFGLNKQLIVLTANGKIFNLELETGNINWKFDQLSKFNNQGKLQITKFLNDNNKAIKVFFNNGDLLVLNPANGNIIDSITNSIPANDDIIPINLNELIVEQTELHNHTNVLLDDDLIIEDPATETLQYVAKGESNAGAPKDQLDKDFFFAKLDKSKTSIQAYKVNAAHQQVSKTWKFQVSDPQNEKIIAYSYNSINHEGLASIGLILGDKSVLYKYLYPNLAAFAIHNTEENSLIINVIDSITGRIIKSVSHLPNEKLDLVNYKFQLLVNDNYVIYTFHSYRPSVSSKINVIEFYESKFSNERTFANTGTAEDNNSGHSDSYSVLANDLPEPFVKFKSYNFPLKIDKLSLSNTRFDITTKNLILKLNNGQILLLPKFLISSRRVEGRELTKEEKMEYLMMPYDANVPINNNAIINHKRLIYTKDLDETISSHQNEHLFSLATNLESTSIVCYLNNDLFCTKIYPSLQFDMLSTSFSKVKLLLTIAGLLGAFVISRSLVQQKKVNSFWVDKL